MSTSTDLRKKTLAQLREMCKQKGLKTTGNKAQLIERLEGSVVQAATTEEAVATSPAAPAVEIDPAFVTPKKERKRKAAVEDVRGIADLESPENGSPGLDRAQEISNTLAKAVKRIQNFVWMKGTHGGESSQEELSQDAEAPQITEARLLGQYLKDHEQLFMALSHDCKACFDFATPQSTAPVLQTFVKVLEAVDKSLNKLAELELASDLHQFYKDICVMVDGNLEAPRLLPFDEALTYAWFLLGLCAAMSDPSLPVVSSILNTMDERGIDPAQCHNQFEGEAHGFVLSEMAWQRLEKLFEDKETWKLTPKKRKAIKKPAAAPAA